MPNFRSGDIRACERYPEKSYRMIKKVSFLMNLLPNLAGSLGTGNFDHNQLGVKALLFLSDII